MITYDKFIKELRTFGDEAHNLRSAKDMHEDESFRRWRNKLDGLLSQITQVNYLLLCPVRIKSRRFGGYGYTPDENQKEQQFVKYQMPIIRIMSTSDQAKDN